MARKGILMAGGSGSRLYPITRIVSKQLLPVYDKPMIYYPLSTLMSAGLRDILLISTPQDTPHFHALLGDGSQWGVNVHYAIQSAPDGLAQAFIIGRDFIGGDASALILGDNLFHGENMTRLLTDANRDESATAIFAYHVQDPQRYGVVEFDGDFTPLSIQEKPSQARSHYAVTGLYFYDDQVCEVAKGIKPSARGECEITDINAHYLAAGKLNVRILGSDDAWRDMGTHDSLLEASSLIASLQKRQRALIGCPEEMAFRQGWITAEQLDALAFPLRNSAYGQSLMNILSDGLAWPSL